MPEIKHRALIVSTLSVTLGLGACSDEPREGTLTVLLEAEETITGGLEPGEEGENIRDGWQVLFESYLLVVGDIDLHFASDESLKAEAGELFAVDLVSLPPSGLPLWTFEGLRAGRWEFNYATSGAAHGAVPHDSVDEADFNRMVNGDWTYLISGRLTQAGGRLCPPARLAKPGAGAMVEGGANAGGDPCYSNPQISFKFGVSAETRFGPCEVDGIPGVSVAAGGTQSAAITIHGDHLFFNSFPEGDEGGVMRLAQWLADSDLNLDGNVVREELESIQVADLPEIDGRYHTGGSLLELDNMWTYVRAQLKTQGHMDGEGECPPDGVPHED